MLIHSLFQYRTFQEHVKNIKEKVNIFDKLKNNNTLIYIPITTTKLC